jgi:hypothetical protein
MYALSYFLQGDGWVDGAGASKHNTCCYKMYVHAEQCFAGLQGGGWGRVISKQVK